MSFKRVFRVLVLSVVVFASSAFAKGKIILINGCVLSGSNVIAEILAVDLATETGEGWWNFSKDRYVSVVSEGKESTGLDKLLGEIKAQIDNNENVVVDWSFVEDCDFRKFRATFLDYDVFFVGVDCSKDQALANLKNYGKDAAERLPVYKVDDFKHLIGIHFDPNSLIHADKIYDFEICTNGMNSYYDLGTCTQGIMDAFFAFDFDGSIFKTALS